jgi:hypothetical protein
MFNVECDGALMIGKLSTPLFPLAAASMARKMLEVVVSRSEGECSISTIDIDDNVGIANSC